MRGPGRTGPPSSSAELYEVPLEIQRATYKRAAFGLAARHYYIANKSPMKRHGRYTWSSFNAGPKGPKLKGQHKGIQHTYALSTSKTEAPTATLRVVKRRRKAGYNLPFQPEFTGKGMRNPKSTSLLSSGGSYPALLAISSS